MKYLLIALLLISTQAQAATWILITQDYQAGGTWICTYQLQGTEYITRMVQQNPCEQYIFQ